MTKILYVEDEPFLGKIVKESLESRGYDVLMLADGREIATHYQQFMPDVCVFDVMLPFRDGYALAQDIRQLDKQIPILFLTAKTQTEDVLKGFGAGGNDYIRKPFSMEELIVRVQNLRQFTKNNQSETTSIVLGKYEFLPNRYELKCGENVKKLSNRETELLKILAENRNFTVNRKDILLKIWHDDSFFNSRNLDVYIARLRDYLRQDSQLEIMTLKGVGYLFKVS